MLRLFAPWGLAAVLKAGYGPELLAVPLLDEASPSPEVRAQAANMPLRDFKNLASSFSGAQPPYLAHHKTKVEIIDVPYSHALYHVAEVGIRKYGIKLNVDHVGWARRLGFTRNELFFQHWNLRDFLKLVKGQKLCVRSRDLVAYTTTEYQWIYKSDSLLAEAQQLGKEAFDGFTFKIYLSYDNPEIADLYNVRDWEELGAQLL